VIPLAITNLASDWLYNPFDHFAMDELLLQNQGVLIRSDCKRRDRRYEEQAATMDYRGTRDVIDDALPLETSPRLT